MVSIKRKPGAKPATSTSRKAQPREYDPQVDGVHQSAIALWLECREKARVRYVLNLDVAVMSKPLIFGDLSHKAIASCYKAMADGSCATLKRAQSEVSGWVKAAELLQEEERGHMTADELDVREESAAILEHLLPLYFGAWWERDKEEVEWVGVERKFSTSMVGPRLLPAPMAGTYDGVFRRRKDKRLWLLETKNKGRWSKAMADFLPLDLQVNLYLAALNTEAKVGADVPAGVRYNLLRRPQERRGQNEAISSYVDRIAARAKKEPEHFFERFDMSVVRSDLEAATARSAHLVRAFVEWFDRSKADPVLSMKDPMLNSAACEGKYGLCPYLGACSANDPAGLKRVAPH